MTFQENASGPLCDPGALASAEPHGLSSAGVPSFPGNRPLRLKTHLLLWLLLATVVPLMVLALGATRYSEVVYRRAVDQDLNVMLGSVVGEMTRRLQSDWETIHGPSSVPAPRKYLGSPIRRLRNS